MINTKDSFLSAPTTFLTKRFRVTILLILTLMGLGLLTYTTLLKREGFPTINVPILLVQTPYLSGDIEKTEKDVTSKIYNAVKGIEDIDSIQTSSTENFSSVVVYFKDDFKNIDDAKKEVESTIKLEANLSANVNTVVSVPNAGSVDGKHSLLFTLYSNNADKDLNSIATNLQEKLTQSKLVKEANVIAQVEDRIDFRTGQVVPVKVGFARFVENIDGKLESFDGINIGLIKASDNVSTLDFSKEVRSIVEKELEKYDSVFVSYGGDPANSLNAQIKSLESNAIAAVITIIFVLFVFINLRSSLILGLFIPLTLGGVFIVFYLFGLTLNTISLFALVLVLGLFVDDGTVVVEAIDYYKRKGYKGLNAVKMAINDIGIADISGTLTTLLVFFPLLFVSGILGDFIKELPLTVIISLAVSLVIALTILPVISSFLIPNKITKPTNKYWLVVYKVLNFFPNIINHLSLSASKFTNFYLSKKRYTFVVLIVSLFLIGYGASFASKLGFSFFAQAKDADSITVSVNINGNSDVDFAKSKVLEVESILKDNFTKDILEVDYLRATAPNVVLSVELTPLNNREITSLEIANVINEKSKDIKGINVVASSVVAGPPTSQFPFAMQVYSNSQNDLDSLTNRISEFIKNNVTLNNNIIVEEVQIQNLNNITKIDSQRLAQIRVKFNDNSSSAVLLDLKSKIENEFNTDKLESLNFKDVKLDFDFGQESENAESFNSVIVAGILALIIIYSLLVLQFNSFSQPLLVLLAIPFTFPGLFVGLYLTNNPFSFFVVIGLTGLIGIVVNNTIMLLEYANSRRKDGVSIKQSISEAVSLRLRPILATSTTTVAGLLPLALTEPFWEPLALTIIFGLVSSVIFVLTVFPAFYAVFEKARSSRNSFFAKLLRI